MWDGWTASLTWCTWVWASSGRWRRTGKPGVLQSMGSQRAGHGWATEQQQQQCEETLISHARGRELKHGARIPPGAVAWESTLSGVSSFCCPLVSFKSGFLILTLNLLWLLWGTAVTREEMWKDSPPHRQCCHSPNPGLEPTSPASQPDSVLLSHWGSLTSILKHSPSACCLTISFTLSNKVTDKWFSVGKKS